MADVTGPISTLPGSRRDAPVGAMCDEHPDRPATARIQGETDSFGSEMHDLCDECARELVRACREPREGVCEWCKRPATDLRDRRDWEEGMSGRLYEVCGACVREENERLAAEMDEDDWDDGRDYDLLNDPGSPIDDEHETEWGLTLTKAPPEPKND